MSQDSNEMPAGDAATASSGNTRTVFAPPIPRDKTRKTLLFTVGTKGGIGKTTVLTQLLGWYRIVCGAQVQCVDFDETLNFFRLSEGNGKPLTRNDYVGGESSHPISNFIDGVPDMEADIILCDLPASALDDARVLVDEIKDRLRDLGRAGVSVAFLFTVNKEDSSVTMASEWVKLVKDIPCHRFLVTNSGAGPVADNGMFTEISDHAVARLGKFPMGVDPLTKVTKTPLVYAASVYSYHLDEDWENIAKLGGQDDFIAMDFLRQTEAGVKKNWTWAAVCKGSFSFGRISNVVDELFRGFGRWGAALVPPAIEQAMIDHDKEAGFPEPPEKIGFYARIRFIPDVGEVDPGWPATVSVSELADRFYPGLPVRPGREVPASSEESSVESEQSSGL